MTVGDTCREILHSWIVVDLILVVIHQLRGSDRIELAMDGSDRGQRRVIASRGEYGDPIGSSRVKGVKLHIFFLCVYLGGLVEKLANSIDLMLVSAFGVYT